MRTCPWITAALALAGCSAAVTGSGTSGSQSASSSSGGGTSSGGSGTGGGAGGCTIDGLSYVAGATDPTDACRSCQPSEPNSWTTVNCPASQVCHNGSCVTGSPSGCGGACPSGQVCIGTSCQNGCAVNGVTVENGDPNPANSCEVCTSATSTTAYQPLTGLAPDGGCVAGEVCDTGSCAAGCYIDGFIAAGATLPGDPCESCDPAKNTGDWTPVTGPAPQDSACPAGQVCNAGACAAGCFIAGSFVAPAAANPAHGCRSCEPATSTSVWTSGFTTWTTPFDGGAAVGVVADFVYDTLPGLVFSNGSGSENSGGGMAWENKGDAGFRPSAAFDLAAVGAGVAAPLTSPPYDDIFFAAQAGGVEYLAQSFSHGLDDCHPSVLETACAGGAGLQVVGLAPGHFPGASPAMAFADAKSKSIGIFTGDLQTYAATPLTATPVALAGGDFNGDGLTDLAVVTATSQLLVDDVQVWLSQTDGGFSLAGGVSSFQASPGVSVAIADFNGDGNPDVALAPGGADILIALGDGTGNLGVASSSPAANNGAGLLAGDFNGDGWPDLAVAADGDIGILLNNGDGTFAPAIQIATAGQVNALAASSWTPPAASSTYGSPTNLIGATDGVSGIALRNDCY